MQTGVWGFLCPKGTQDQIMPQEGYCGEKKWICGFSNEEVCLLKSFHNTAWVLHVEKKQKVGGIKFKST